MIIIDGFTLILKPGGTKFYLLSFLQALSDYLKNHEPTNTYKLIIPKLNALKTSFDYAYTENLTKYISSSQIKIEYVNINDFFFRLCQFFGINENRLHRYVIFFWEHYYMPKIVKQNNPEVVFHPYQIVSNYKTHARKVVVIHDIFHWKYQERYSFIEKFLYNMSKKGCEETDTIITISETSKKEILNYLKIPENKIKVCYEGYNQLFENFLPQIDIVNETRLVYRLPSRYVLAISSERKYKNTIGALKVFHEIIHHPNLSNLKLLLVGPSIENNAEVKNYVVKNNLEQKTITINNFLKPQDLCYLYHMADYFIFLSYEEGFGLPPLESLACHTLPIISNASSLGELFSQNLPSFAPNDYHKIAQYIIELENNPDKKKKILIASCQILLNKFSWKNILPLYIKLFYNKKI